MRVGATVPNGHGRPMTHAEAAPRADHIDCAGVLTVTVDRGAGTLDWLTACVVCGAEVAVETPIGADVRAGVAS